MDTKNRNVTNGILMLIFVIATASTSCKKISGCVTTTGYNEYLVEIPVKLYPVKDTFAIGDTMWLEQNFSEQLYDQRNNMTLNFKDFDFALKMVISDLINYSNISEPLHSKFVEVGNIEITNTGAVFVKYNYQNGIYTHRMGIIMTKKGLFYISTRSLNREKADFTKCQTENLDIRYSVNDKAENNFYMMKNSKDSIALKTTKEEFDKFGSYCFFVK